MKQNFKRWMLAAGIMLLHTQTIFAQQATQVDLTDEKFNLEGWMFMGAGMAIFIALVLLFFINKLFTRTALDNKKSKKARQHANQAKKEDKVSVNVKRTSAAQSKKQAEELARQKAKEEQRRVEELARQKAEEEKRHAEELARQKAKEEQRHAEELARQKAEEEQRRAAGAFQVVLAEISEQAKAKAIRMDLNDEKIVGRSVQKCDVVIADDPTVSGMHCQFYAFEGKVYVMDLDSTNGTYVNDKRIHHAVVIRPGDLILIGSKEYRINW